jgi:hypothetical protein
VINYIAERVVLKERGGKDKSAKKERCTGLRERQKDQTEIKRERERKTETKRSDRNKTRERERERERADTFHALI